MTVEKERAKEPGRPRSDANDVRRRAEDLLRARGLDAGPADGSPESRLVHELRVHQIELEMQNEELRHALQELELSRARYFDLYDLAPVGYLTLTEASVVVEANLTALTMAGRARVDVVGQPFSRFISPEDQDVAYLHRRRLFETLQPQHYEIRIVRPDATTLWTRIDANVALESDGGRIARLTIEDISEHKRIDSEREALLVELKKTLAEVRTLRGIVPICAACKRIRDGDGKWRPVETYVTAHTNAQFSHGLCPECIDHYSNTDE